jgi:nitrite reductase/ring-hydroxylating ferredoxin subunit
VLAFSEGELLDRLAVRNGIAVTIGDNTVAVFKIEGAIRAIEAACLRCGASLADGTLDGLIVACGGCDWRYDVSTGAVVGVRVLRLRTFRVDVVGGKVVLKDA